MTADPYPHYSTEASAAPGAVPLQAARRHRAMLLRGLQVFEQALAAPAGDPAWRDRVRDRLHVLRAAFAEHIQVTEGPEGLYAELLEHAPRLTRRVHVLVREHAAVLSVMSTLERRACLPETTVEELRIRSNDLLRALSRHRQRGADVVYEAYQLDIGGET